MDSPLDSVLLNDFTTDSNLDQQLSKAQLVWVCLQAWTYAMLPLEGMFEVQ
jgi:hypothetical protein